jgi:hypothetical protein
MLSRLRVVEIWRLLLCALLQKKHHVEEWGYFSVWIRYSKCQRVVQRTFLS